MEKNAENSPNGQLLQRGQKINRHTWWNQNIISGKRFYCVSLYIDKDKSTDMGKCDSVEAQLRTAEIITLQEVPSLDR